MCTLHIGNDIWHFMIYITLYIGNGTYNVVHIWSLYESHHDLHTFRLFAQVNFQLNTWFIYEMSKTCISQLFQTRNRNLLERNYMWVSTYNTLYTNHKVTYFYVQMRFTLFAQITLLDTFDQIAFCTFRHFYKMHISTLCEIRSRFT